MSDENTPVGTPTPAVAPVPAPAPAPVAAAPVPAPAPAAAAPTNDDPAWLPDRLRRAEKSAREAVLAELGITNADEGKAAVAAAKAAADAKKSAEERAADLASQLTATKTAAERQAALAKEMAGRMFMALSPEHQKAVTDFAGDDPEKQYLAIKHFGPTWAEAERIKEAAAKAAAVPVPAPAAPVASTSPAPAAPTGETPASPADPKSIYATTRAANPFKAAAYGLANPTVVYQNQ